MTSCRPLSGLSLDPVTLLPSFIVLLHNPLFKLWRQLLHSGDTQGLICAKNQGELGMTLNSVICESPDHMAGSAEPAQVSVSAICAAGRCPQVWRKGPR